MTACSSGAPSSAARRDLQTSGGRPESAASVNKTALRFTWTSWGNTISYNPFAAAGYASFGFQYAQLNLAYIDPVPGPGPYGGYSRELASGWRVTHSSITIDLRRDAKWQNGHPVTSADVRTSLLLSGLNSNQMWASIAGLSTPNPHKVVIRLLPGAVPLNVLNSVVQVVIVPTSQYHQLLPRGAQADLVAYWRTYDALHPSTASIAAASASSAGKAIQAALAKLVKYDPPSLLGDGPYELVRANSSAVLLKKWAGWWDSRAVRAPYLEMLAIASPATEYGAILGGRVDWDSDLGFSDTELARLKRTQYAHYLEFPAPVQEFGLVFHVTDYPYNLLPVRKAIAYVIDRSKLEQLANGGSLRQQVASSVPDALPSVYNTRYLGRSKLKRLNHYGVNTSKAAGLLKQAGFEKRGGVWYTSKGQPFSMTVYVPSGVPTLVQGGIALANMLHQFGIKASSQAIDISSFFTQEDQGKFPVSYGIVSDGFINPLQYFESTFLNLNYPVTYSGKGPCPSCHPGIGIGPIDRVPGLGQVNLSAAINEEMGSAPPSQWRRYVWDWARYIDNNLPVLTLFDNVIGEVWSSQRYRDWPPLSNHSLWADWFGPQLLFFMQRGYLRLRPSR